MADPGETVENEREATDDLKADAEEQPMASLGPDGSPATDADDEAAGSADRRRLRLAGLAAVVTLAAGLAVGLYLLVRSQEDELASLETVSMPDVVGQRETQAVKQLESQEIQYELERGPSTEQPSGYVYDQDPNGGTLISPETDVVTLFISTGPTTTGPPTTEVPDMRGRSRDDAVAALATAGLKADVHEVSSNQPPNTVTAQHPKPGEIVEEGATVRVNVSAGGPPTTAVPDVRGHTRDVAVAALTAAKLDPDVREVNSNEPQNTVVAQDPGPGKVVNEGTMVHIDVSSGPKPNGVPSVVGQPYESASAQLETAGFQVARRDAASNTPAGIVISQSPAGGETAPPGARVTLTVSKGLPPAAVPDVISLDRDTAVTTLKNSGFKANVEEEDTDDPSLDGVVLSQDPAGGTQAKPGSSVTIVVGRFALPVETTAAASGFTRAHAPREKAQGS